MAKSKRAVGSTKDNSFLATGTTSGVKVLVNEDGSYMNVNVSLPNGTMLTLNVSKHGYVRVDHAKGGEGLPTEDLRTILDGLIHPRKRTFSVYSSSGYANHYKGKPNVPLGAAVTVAAGSPAAAKSTASSPSPAPTAGAASTPTSTASASTAALAFADVKEGMKVKAGADKGEVTGVGMDGMGSYIEVEFDDAGYMSLYKEDFERMGVTRLDPPVKKSGGTEKAATSSASSAGSESPATPSSPTTPESANGKPAGKTKTGGRTRKSSPKKSARKGTKVKKASLHYDIDALVRSTQE